MLDKKTKIAIGVGSFLALCVLAAIGLTVYFTVFAKKSKTSAPVTTDADFTDAKFQSGPDYTSFANLKISGSSVKDAGVKDTMISCQAACSDDDSCHACSFGDDGSCMLYQGNVSDMQLTYSSSVAVGLPCVGGSVTCNRDGGMPYLNQRQLDSTRSADVAGLDYSLDACIEACAESDKCVGVNYNADKESCEIVYEIGSLTKITTSATNLYAGIKRI